MNRQEFETLRKAKSFKRVIDTEKLDQAIYEMLPYFEHSILLGDSMAESILDYRLLRKNNVIAKRGKCVDMIDEELEKVFILEPEHLFLEFGKNDILHFRGDIRSFISCYSEKILRIQESLPETRIYVNSIIPMHQKVLDRIGGYMVLDAFNHALALMCRHLGLAYIDNSGLISFKNDDFEFDGIHPKYPYYMKWLKHMAKTAGIYHDVTIPAEAYQIKEKNT